MKLAVRLDDITPGMDSGKFLRMKELLFGAGICPLLGVVPENKDRTLIKEAPGEDFWDNIRALKEEGAVIAMHGLSHVYDTKEPGIFPLNPFSEFAGHSFSEQRERIRRGKAILKEHGLETDIFMAPGHSFDGNTLRTLKEEGFRYITDGFGREPYLREGLVFLPISFRKKDSVDPRKAGYTTLVFHTNEMTDSDFESLERLIENRGEQFFPYGEFLTMNAKRRGAAGSLGEYLLAGMKSRLVRWKLRIQRGLH